MVKQIRIPAELTAEQQTHIVDAAARARYTADAETFSRGDAADWSCAPEPVREAYRAAATPVAQAVFNAVTAIRP